MRCPYCRNEDSKVIDSRNVDEVVRRRRECLGCGERFTTQERVEAATVFVIKKDGRREEFNRAKLATGIRKACEKRPLPTGAIEKVVDDIETELLSTGKTELASSNIGEMVMRRLRDLDHIAYIRFASVYRQFADIDDVRRELEALSRSPDAGASGQLPLIPPEQPVVALATRRRARPLSYGAQPKVPSGG